MDGLLPDYVQPRPRLAGPVVLAEPDPTWARQYADEEARVRAALGDRVLQLEHVGSTSVEGLAAKPVIDIVLVVADSADEAAYVPDLEVAGYLLYLREPGWHQHRLLRGKEPLVHLHVFSPGGPEVERLLLFRDRLRTQPDDRELYQRSKRDLAARRWEYVQDYADAKSAVVEEIIARARAEET